MVSADEFFSERPNRNQQGYQQRYKQDNQCQKVDHR
jgi:hypothetical protein